MELVTLSMPLAVIASLIAFKLNHETKRWLFKVPTWLSSSIISWLLAARFVGGVATGTALAICELLLWPFMIFMKKLWEKKEKQLQEKTVTLYQAA